MYLLGVNAGEVNETETREKITESLKKAEWQLHKNMRYEYKITDGRVHIDEDDEPFREKALFADYLLFAPNGKPLAVVEAKREGELEGTGIQQAIKYATLLDAPFAFSSNGKSFEFYCLSTAEEESFDMDSFPSQKTLWERFCTNQNYTSEQLEVVEKPYYNDADGREPRYYQRIVIDRVVDAFARGQKRMMFVMATGTGKTYEDPLSGGSECPDRPDDAPRLQALWEEDGQDRAEERQPESRDFYESLSTTGRVQPSRRSTPAI